MSVRNAIRRMALSQSIWWSRASYEAHAPIAIWWEVKPRVQCQRPSFITIYSINDTALINVLHLIMIQAYELHEYIICRAHIRVIKTSWQSGGEKVFVSTRQCFNSGSHVWIFKSSWCSGGEKGIIGARQYSTQVLKITFCRLWLKLPLPLSCNTIWPRLFDRMYIKEVPLKMQVVNIILFFAAWMRAENCGWRVRWLQVFFDMI